MKTQEKLEYIIESFGLNKKEFAKKIEVSQQTLSNYIHQNLPIGSDIAKRIVAAFPNINIGWLLSSNGEAFISQKYETAKSFNIPLIENVTCGTPLPSQLDESSYIVSDEKFQNKFRIAVRLSGDSMFPYIRDGDIVLCYKMESGDKIKKNKAYVIDFKSAAVGSKEGICKLVYEMNDGTLLLSSINTYGYDPIHVKKSEVRNLYRVYKLIREVS